MPVVVDDDDPSGARPRPQMEQLMFGRFIPIGVQAQQGNIRRSLARDGLLDSTFHVMDQLSGIVRIIHIALDFVERTVGQNKGLLRWSSVNRRSRASISDATRSR